VEEVGVDAVLLIDKTEKLGGVAGIAMETFWVTFL
jgi:hypothetical protein